MSNALAPGICAGRLGEAELAENFADLHPPLTAHEALVAADRCYFCFDAPCTAACPTEIDIPLFIRQIAAGRPKEAARTIFEQNILGGMCARVCPTETLCEEACVREAAEGEPVQIGRLQRFATDRLMAEPGHPFHRARPTGRSVAIVGAGPAGLAAAHRLALLGHEVKIFDARPRGGGLNEYGIAAYKTVNGFAQAELDWLLGVGGIELLTEQRLGDNLDLGELLESHDAVLLAIGLGGVNGLGVPGEDLPGVEDAVDFIARLRQAGDLSAVPVGRRVVVIGGGMTAIDAAVQSRLLGAETVTIVYRRDRAAMPASRYEQDLAASRGVSFRFNARPTGIAQTADGLEIRFAYTEATPEGLRDTGQGFALEADQIFKAIGQTLDLGGIELERDGGKIRVDGLGRTSHAKIWAAGDCAAGGKDLTVTAVAEGRDAAEHIHAALMGSA
ncbi:MAG: NAD(P)-dependent oxidoreductase [Alphaproteobacteria bacterium]|nr:MAG: NAD(P)-dependent oxidoreductase [Alphaproteobacteria bacterium]